MSARQPQEQEQEQAIHYHYDLLIVTEDQVTINNKLRSTSFLWYVTLCQPVCGSCRCQYGNTQRLTSQVAQIVDDCSAHNGNDHPANKEAQTKATG
jgi:hypothetical protein